MARSTPQADVIGATISHYGAKLIPLLAGSEHGTLLPYLATLLPYFATQCRPSALLRKL